MEEPLQEERLFSYTLVHQGQPEASLLLSLRGRPASTSIGGSNNDCGHHLPRLAKAGDISPALLLRGGKRRLSAHEIFARFSRRDPGPAAGVGGRGQTGQA